MTHRSFRERCPAEAREHWWRRKIIYFTMETLCNENGKEWAISQQHQTPGFPINELTSLPLSLWKVPLSSSIVTFFHVHS